MAAINADMIPQEVRALQQWCTYKIELIDGKLRKVPYDVATGKRASSINPATWTKFEAALAAYRDLEIYDGICFMLLKENGLVFIDLDNSADEDGTIRPYALEIVRRFNSYSERSQSGRGLHILIKAKKPGPRCRRKSSQFDVEIYDHARQCCFTGDVVAI